MTLSPEEWNLGIALSQQPRSPAEAAARTEALAYKFDLSFVDAAIIFIDDYELMSDPTVQRSVRQFEVGDFTPIDVMADSI
jgi:hypothetical protein